MNQNLIKIGSVICPLALSSSCVKVQVNPEGIVADTVSTGKSLYKTIKRKKDGTEERLYTRTVALSPEAGAQRVGSECLDYLTESVNAATDKKPQILEAGTEIVNSESGNKVVCSMRAVL